MPVSHLVVIQVIKVIPNPHGALLQSSTLLLFSLTAEFETDARGIAAELERLHQDGAIANKSAGSRCAFLCELHASSADPPVRGVLSRSQ